VSEVPLRELAQVIRSKNAGPFEVTFDIMFDDPAKYEHVKKSGAINAALLAASVLALSDGKLAKRLETWRKKQSDAVAEAPEDKA